MLAIVILRAYKQNAINCNKISNLISKKGDKTLLYPPDTNASLNQKSDITGKNLNLLARYFCVDISISRNCWRMDSIKNVSSSSHILAD